MRKKRTIILLVIATVVFLLLAVLFTAISITVAQEIPRITEYSRSRLSSGLTFGTFERLDTFYTGDLSVYAEFEPEQVERLSEVKPVLVNENFFSVFNIAVDGSGITKQHVDDRLPAIVVSDRAALRMSLDGNVVGQKIKLYSKAFIIVGKYKTSDGFLSQISSDIYDRIYIPYTCYDDYADVSVDSFAAPTGSYSEKNLPILGLNESDTRFYIKNDLAVRHDIVAHFPVLLLSILSIIIAAICIKRLLKLTKSSFEKLRTEYENIHMKEVIRRNRGFIVLRLLGSVLLIGVPTALIILFPPKIIIPQNVPYDNVFDVGHYIGVFKSQMQMYNSNLPAGNAYYVHLFFDAFLAEVVLLPVLIVLSASIFRRLRRLLNVLTAIRIRINPHL